MIGALLLLAALIAVAVGLCIVWPAHAPAPRRTEALHVEHDLSHDTRRRLLAGSNALDTDRHR